MESNWPIVIGAAQLSERDVTLETATNPVDMLARVMRDAAESSGGDPNLIASIQAGASIQVAICQRARGGAHAD